MEHQIASVLESQLEFLTDLLETKQKALKKSPVGSLRISKSNNCSQYFHIKESEVGKGEYIPRKKRNLARTLAQKDYDSKILPLVENEIKLIQHFLSKSHETKLFSLYQQLHPARKILTNPVFLPDEEFVTNWLAATYPKKPFSEGMPEHYTDSGLRVRSKSEVIIANKLSKLDIPFRYEAPVELTVNRKSEFRTVTFHPDFTCLNKRTRQVFIWEHFGMMDKSDYAKDAVEKERLYAAAGYIHGLNFIATTETTDLPLNSKYVEQIARKLLL